MGDESPTAILDATNRARCERGYADLALRAIAAEADVSEAAIHYHYGSKDRLFAAFLDYRDDRHTAQLRSLDGATSPDRLGSLFETLPTTTTARPGTGSGRRCSK